MSKYQVQQSVIILEEGTGKILASGKIVSYESIRDKYRVSYQLGDDPTIWIDDVKEDRLTT